jgi:Uma2 family endonuclease
MSVPQTSTQVETELYLPGAEDLPCSDDTPVDNEDQNDIPNWLRIVLLRIWADRQDWFFGVDMGIYDREGQRKRTPNLIPDGFLSLGVQRRKGTYGRLSYVLAEENNVVPILVLECISKTYNGEYKEKLQSYAAFGIKYYVVYNPQKRRQHQPLEVYKLEDNQYTLQPGEPIWLPELGLGIGRVQGEISNVPMQWLAWFDVQNQPYALPDRVIEDLEKSLTKTRLRLEQAENRAERAENFAEQAQAQAEQERTRAEQAENRAEQAQAQAEQERIRAEQAQIQAEQERAERLKLLERLREMGIDWE